MTEEWKHYDLIFNVRPYMDINLCLPLDRFIQTLSDILSSFYTEDIYILEIFY